VRTVVEMDRLFLWHHKELVRAIHLLKNGYSGTDLPGVCLGKVRVDCLVGPQRSPRPTS
jgi:hypothetical protein